MEFGDSYNAGWTCKVFAQARREQGDLTGALELSSRAYALFTELEDQHGKGVASNSLSGIHRQLGDAALARSADAVESFRSINDH